MLSVVSEHRERFRVEGIAARIGCPEIVTVAAKYRVSSVAITDRQSVEGITDGLKQAGVSTIYAGQGALAEQAGEIDYDLLVNAVSGGAGLEPTAAALNRGRSVALANKETLVAAGQIMNRLAAEHNARILPIDSEHSAIFQCLMGEHPENVRRLWLTTSGGPFWGRSRADVESVSVEDALAHPTWKMGPKITIDSATLFNKGLEVIEAARLFGLPVEQICVVAHRQSIVHSMVEMIDGSIKAQMSVPDMRLPIIFALTYPERVHSTLVQSDVAALGTLSFEPVPVEDFPCLRVCYDALRRGGSVPAAISAADEVAVNAFLNNEIRFGTIAEVLEGVIHKWPDESVEDIASVRRSDLRAREMAERLVQELRGK